MTASGIYKNRSKRGIKWPNLFANTFSNVRCKSTNISEDITKIETIMKYLIKLLSIKNYSTQVESVLFEATELPCTQTSKKLQTLSMLIKEAIENMMFCGQILKKLPAHIQTKTLLNLVNNFICEWGEKPCETRSHLKICKFCDSIINDETRQYARKYCCVEAEYLDRLSKEWPSLRASDVIAETHDTELRLITTTNQDDTTFDNYKNRINFRMKINLNISTKAFDKRQRNISDASREVDFKKIGSGVETNHSDRFIDEDPSEANGIRSLQHGKTEMSDEARSDDGTRNTDRVAERIREKRDNNPRKLGEVEDKNQQDRRSAQRDVQEETNRSQIAAEKRRGSRDMEDAIAEEEEDKKKKKSGERRNPSKNSYQQCPREEREIRLSDSNAEKIDRLDRVEEKSVRDKTTEISRKLAKRLEHDLEDEPDRRDRCKENLDARKNRKKEVKNKDDQADTVLLSKTKGFESKRTTDSVGDTEKGRSTVNEEGKLSASNGKRKNASIDDTEKARKRTVNSSNLIEYQLSNAHFVELGWTRLPVTKIMRKIVRYEARPAKPGLDWFKKYRHRGTVYYDDGLTLFSRFHPDGSGELFYPNGVLAIRVYRPENRKYDMYTVFTPGGKDTLAIERESQILAIFDTMGYGVVFDMDGAARLSYNQIGGIFTDNPAGLPLVWTWNVNPRESILETVYTENVINRQMEFFSSTGKSTESSGNVKTPISPSSSRNKEKKVVEVQKPVVVKRQEEVGSKSNNNPNLPKEDIYHIKVICMKLNKFLGLRIIDQKNISLRFSAKNKSIRIELGIILNFNKEVASYMVEASDWKSDILRCRFQEKLSKKLESENSLYDLAKEYQKVKRFAKERKAMIAKYKPFSEMSRVFS